MRAKLSNLPRGTWLLLMIPAVLAAYPLVRIVVPEVLHALVPQVVRTVLSIM